MGTRESFRSFCLVACFALPLALSWRRRILRDPPGYGCAGNSRRAASSIWQSVARMATRSRYAALFGQGVFRNTDDFFFWAIKNSGLPSGLLGRMDVRGLATSQRGPRVAYWRWTMAIAEAVSIARSTGAQLWQLQDWKLVGRAQAVAVFSLGR